MAEVQKKPVKIVETVLRDAHQSLLATRMTTEQMLPIVDKMDKVGYYAVECWGGATFDSCLRFLKEDPWERLRKLRAGFKNTKLQMLFRGQNILGWESSCGFSMRLSFVRDEQFAEQLEQSCVHSDCSVLSV